MQMPAKNQRGIIAFQSNVHTLISFPTVSIKSDQFTALTSRPGLIDLVRSKGNFGRIGSEFIKKNENWTGIRIIPLIHNFIRFCYYISREIQKRQDKTKNLFKNAIHKAG